MSSLPKLVSLYSELDGRPKKAIDWIARQAREGGKISSGKRGRGASAMTEADACSLILAANCADEAIQSPMIIDQMKSLSRASVFEFEWESRVPFDRLLSADTLDYAIQAILTDHGRIQENFDTVYARMQPDFTPKQRAKHLDNSLGIDLTVWRFGAQIEGWHAQVGKRRTFLKATYHRNVRKMREGFYHPEPSKYRVTKSTLSFRMMHELGKLICPTKTDENSV